MTKIKKKQFGKFLSTEIVIEYKACLYFSCMTAFYFVFQIIRNIDSARILTMFEIILTAYVIAYFQVYILHNPDEAERFGKKEAIGVLLCSGFYTGMSHLFAWFDRTPAVTAAFFLYCIIVYYCVYICNKLIRRSDTNRLNRMLTEYKKKESKDGAGD